MEAGKPAAPTIGSGDAVSARPQGLDSDQQVARTADAAIFAALAAHGGEPGALLPVLHAIHDALGHLPSLTAARVADGLNLSRADVQGVISFYHDFRETPPGRHVVKVCRAEACQAMGSEALVERLHTRHGARLHHTTSDGAVTLEPVYCLGNCALSPALLVDGRLLGRVTAERLDALLGTLTEQP